MLVKLDEKNMVTKIQCGERGSAQLSVSGGGCRMRRVAFSPFCDSPALPLGASELVDTVFQGVLCVPYQESRILNFSPSQSGRGPSACYGS